MLTQEMRSALAEMDRAAAAKPPAPEPPKAPVFSWSARGHRLVLDAIHASTLARAASAEILLGPGLLTFAIAFRLRDGDGTVIERIMVPYSWHADAAKWPTAPATAAWTVALEERQVEIVVADPSGEPLMSRCLPLEAHFAAVLRNRVHGSREANAKREWIARVAAQIQRDNDVDVDHRATDRTVSILLPFEPSAVIS